MKKFLLCSLQYEFIHSVHNRYRLKVFTIYLFGKIKLYGPGDLIIMIKLGTTQEQANYPLYKSELKTTGR
jgi:hypothetical protein